MTLRQVVAIMTGALGVAVLWPSAAIILWGMSNGAFAGPLEGLLLAALSGPVAGALIVAGVWMGITNHSNGAR